MNPAVDVWVLVALVVVVGGGIAIQIVGEHLNDRKVDRELHEAHARDEQEFFLMVFSLLQEKRRQEELLAAAREAIARATTREARTQQDFAKPKRIKVEVISIRRDPETPLLEGRCSDSDEALP